MEMTNDQFLALGLARLQGTIVGQHPQIVEPFGRLLAALVAQDYVEEALASFTNRVSSIVRERNSPCYPCERDILLLERVEEAIQRHDRATAVHEISRERRDRGELQGHRA